MTISIAFAAYGVVLLGLAATAGALGMWNRCLQRALEARLRTTHAHDAITGLPGPLLLHDRLAQGMAGGRRVAVLVVDVDRFRAVNNSLGHDAGDKLLRQVAERLRACTKPGDTVARARGDEFVIAIPGVPDADAATALGIAVLAQFSAPFRVAGHDVYCTASIGIAMHPGDGTTPEALIRHADIAKLRAKDRGRNALAFFTPEMHEHAVTRLRLEAGLRGALERREFVLHYQPRLEVASGRVTGFEALIRWRHPERGLVGPAEFVPMLEQTHLINEVGAWVLEAACAQIREWCDGGFPAPAIAVNISARQFATPGLDVTVERLLARYGIAHELLELELTESMLMQDPEQTAQMLRRLKALGVRIAIDDFGTGYSGLAYLRRFPVDSLKIDRSFLAELDAADGVVMTRAIIELGHALGLRVVAEGVERPMQHARLEELRCDEMQGFLFSPALPAHEIEAWCWRQQR